MTNKPSRRNWSDVQIVIATVSMAVTLAFWNMFAGPDRAAAGQRAQEQTANPIQPVTSTSPLVSPARLSDGKVFFGGSAPQTQIIVHNSGGNGGGGGGGGVVTSTKSS